jgi:Uncharacterized protein conserved in bacteria (DUF2252)
VPTLVARATPSSSSLKAGVEIAARERSFGDAARAKALVGTVRAYREAMRGFAAMGDLDVWYARIDAGSMLEELRAGHDRKLAKSLQRSAAKAYSNDGLRALAELTREVDGEPRFVSNPR